MKTGLTASMPRRTLLGPWRGSKPAAPRFVRQGEWVRAQIVLVGACHPRDQRLLGRDGPPGARGPPRPSAGGCREQYPYRARQIRVLAGRGLRRLWDHGHRDERVERRLLCARRRWIQLCARPAHPLRRAGRPCRDRTAPPRLDVGRRQHRRPDRGHGVRRAEGREELPPERNHRAQVAGRLSDPLGLFRPQPRRVGPSAFPRLLGVVQGALDRTHGVIEMSPSSAKEPFRRGLKTAFLAATLVASTATGVTPARAGWATLPNAPIAPSGYERHDDLFFVSPDSGWVVNGAGEIHRTTDGGESWTHQATLPNYLRCVGFATPFKGWAGTLFGDPLLYATTDAGVTWTPVTNIPPPLPFGICGLSVVNASVAYGCGRYDGPPAVLIKTSDGGATWTSRDMEPLATALIDCHFFDESNGLAVGGDRKSVV